MADLIDNPVINSPFEEPLRHFRFTEEGITDEIVAGRRRSEKITTPTIERASSAIKNGKALSAPTIAPVM